MEICTPSRASAEAAARGGARRVELCRDLACGGLTPADDDIGHCVHRLGLRTHVLVRPRAGGFCYSADEVADIERTILRCRDLGAAAVVVGFLTPDGRVDEPLTRRMVRLASPMEVTFHRAFDEASQPPLEALQAVMAAGCRRLLTSGQAPTALEGAAVIAALVRQARRAASEGHPFGILAGSGVTPDTIDALVAQTAVGEVHGSCKATLADGTVQTSEAAVRRLLARAAAL